jgi:hypothetical protein
MEWDRGILLSSKVRGAVALMLIDWPIPSSQVDGGHRRVIGDPGPSSP